MRNGKQLTLAIESSWDETAIAVVAGSIPGAILGARLAKRVPERALRFGFGAVLMVAAVLLVLQELELF